MDLRPYIGWLLLLAHLLLVRFLRYRRAQTAEAHITTELGRSYKHMTVNQAHDVFTYLSELEFPTIFLNATSFALFKTYGIPRISKLLVDTGQLSDATLSSKRAADTGALLMEIFCNAPTSTRSAAAIERMNHLHGHYQKAGKISDEDMLYTLCLFALEPDRWVSQYEWRDLTDMELCALGTFWRSMGDAMDIPMNALLTKDAFEFSDGLNWFQRAKAWSNAYEQNNLRASPTNRPLADATLDIFLWFLPWRLRPLGVSVITCLLQKRLREAMYYPYPPPLLDSALHIVLLCRKMIIRHLCLPRPSILRCSLRPTPDQSTKRLHAATYILHPWYVRPTWMRRWGPEGWIVWIFGGALPGDRGSEYFPNGFAISEVGPIAFRHNSSAAAQTDVEDIREMRAGCPFVFQK